MKVSLLAFSFAGQLLISSAFASEGQVRFHGIIDTYKILTVSSCDFSPDSTYHVRDTSPPFQLNDGSQESLRLHNGTLLGTVRADLEGCINVLYKMPLAERFGSRTFEYTHVTNGQISKRLIEWSYK